MNVWKSLLLPAFAVGAICCAAGAARADAMTAYTWEILKANPRFYWNFNELTPAGGAVDLVRGQANDTLLPHNNATTAAGASANLGNTAAFDGSSGFQAAAANDGTMPGAWAVELWLQADTTNSAYLVTGGSNNPGLIHAYTGDHIELYRSGSSRTGTLGPRINDNEWHHVVATFYGNNGFGVADRLDFAIDGVVMPDVGRGGFSAGFDFRTTLTVGASGGLTGMFQGKSDEVALYDLSGLTEAQVAARTEQLASHYHLLNAPAETPLRYPDREQISYTYGTQPPATGNYSDPSLTKLTDGVIGSTDYQSYASGDWVGWSNVDPVITFDLGAPVPLDSVFIDYLVGHRVGIHAPDEVLIEFSMDGSDYASLDSIVGGSDLFNNFHPVPSGNSDEAFTSYNRRAIVDLEDTWAQYVRMTVTPGGGSWTFLGEVQFVAVPEPGAGLLLLSALACALLVRRRRAK